MPVTKAERNYLKRKHQGGRNNSKGASYESFYAVYCIASLMERYMQRLDDVCLSSQVEACFVDDLLVAGPDGKRIYHQLKDVKGLTWKAGRLKSDFTRQMELSEEEGEIFRLKLVYSDPKSTVTKIPEELERCTTVSFFPSCSTLNQLLLSYQPFREAIRQITLTEEAKDDELFGVAGILLGVWNGGVQTAISIRHINDVVRRNGKGYVNIKTYPNVELSAECRQILERYGFQFHTSGIKLYWSTAGGRLKGEVEWTPELECRMKEHVPADKFELIELLS